MSHRTSLGSASSLSRSSSFTIALEARVDAKVASLEAKLDARLAWLEARFVGRLDAGLTGVRAETAKWMFRSWATMMLAIVGVAVTVVLRSRGDPTGA